ncbi:DUF2953 domain-containing protein [Paenibacillus doosanensis]|uniref:DUF2953 domain-containing protein n=1 Tax=Paenibacillus konkukensis TaxID=2020716 RepID=A0ABY4RJI1_9BACL|nr:MULTISPECIES: DUF2953 domain-containing protein [Paenibacillus]MCS7464629.1 DUF2953 domain-containing protein [Paenibacillus doosanensis]UQZ81985.1 hypothetical protein SK3146_01142 [Paenibacillus konkukensis]
MIWPWIAGAAVVLLIIFVSSSIQLRFTIMRMEQDDEIILDVHTMYGLVKRKLAIPVIKFLNMEEGVKLKTEVVDKMNEQLKQDGKENITSKKVREAFENMQILLANCFQFHHWLRSTMSHLRCTRLHWKTNVGVGDAAETAMTAGMVWGLKSSLLGFLFRYIQLETRPVIQVVPQYNKVMLASEIQFLAKIRVFYVLLAMLRLLSRILKVKGGFRTWRRVLFKAS